ncbi:peroxiredoxin-like family protein [Robertkochia sediminum]|uniref:peroxiredoxin-like family protein n=1 Tax=Robertkochia sediminum TaxID=2785326 RepID=UPI0019329269|nr:peroxiredoxin-like family protein [Robertkochia sediminum]MBL7471583.1 AhpC/TSA family protein [Robertkochia sediminum]
MSETHRPTPKQQAPSLVVELLGGSTWNLAEQKPEAFTLVVFYRGLHCPLCKKYLKQLEELRGEFAAIGVDVIAISMDSQARARAARMQWELGDLPLGYGLSKETATEWGLYLSAAVKDAEPDLFSEPGLFLIRPDQTVYYASINSNPWGRPYLPTFVKGVQYIAENNYPARGEVIS